MLTETYYLQKNRAKSRNGAAIDLCLLCSAGSEDRVHFIAECNALSSVRKSKISLLEPILTVNNSVLTVNSVINNRILFTQLILDCTSVTVTSRVLLLSKNCHRVGTISRHLYSSIFIGGDCIYCAYLGNNTFRVSCKM